MVIKHKIIIVLLFAKLGFSQTNNLTSSPYSLFGLGKINESNAGVTNSLGRSGLSLSSENELNGLNPASLGTIKLNSFFLDVGLKSDINSFESISSIGKVSTFSFSNISLGFPLNKKSGVSLSLLPYTDVGYKFEGIVNYVDGSTENTISSINGSGGINAMSLSYGRRINTKLNLGLNARYYFGTINQTEIVTIDNDYLSIQDNNMYRGFGLGIGFQYQITERLNLSSVYNFQSNFGAHKDRVVQKSVNQQLSEIESSDNIKINGFKTPTEIALGFKYNLKNYFIVGDYKRSFWNTLNQRDNVGEFVDSNILGFGIEYLVPSRSIFRNYRFRIGYNYDDGNLSINNKKITSNTFTSGIGVPFGPSKKSYLNISYSYGYKGLISNTLIKENIHSFTVNLSLGDIWFVKRKYE